MTAAMPLKRNQPERVSVLVVEDEMLLAMLLEDSLADFGCDVVGPVGRVADGVRLANSERLDGAILDVNVGGTDVFPVARELAKRGIPFVFVSGYDSNHLPRGSLSGIVMPSVLAVLITEMALQKLRCSSNEIRVGHKPQ
jgi:CheY-like chemotaxis protein